MAHKQTKAQGKGKRYGSQQASTVTVSRSVISSSPSNQQTKLFQMQESTKRKNSKPKSFHNLAEQSPTQETTIPKEHYSRAKLEFYLVASLAIERAVDSASDDSNSGVAVALGNVRPAAATFTHFRPLVFPLILLLLPGRGVAPGTLVGARRDGHAHTSSPPKLRHAHRERRQERLVGAPLRAVE